MIRHGALWVVAALAVASAAHARTRSGDAVLHVPRLQNAPSIDDFAAMAPAGPAKSMAKVAGFTQYSPKDGADESEHTEAYVGYDSKSLYVAFVCFQKTTLHAHLGRRDALAQDDRVLVYIDTFLDHQRAYVFEANPRGVQQDMIYTEDSGYDVSFDAIWESQAKITDAGYVVWMSVPFRSIRFPEAERQRWGFVFERQIVHSTEDVCWPWVSASVEGLLNQEIVADGFEGIAPGRNVQVVPYAAVRSFRVLDEGNPQQARFRSDAADRHGGLDAKAVLHDSLVLDSTLNPDFSQVESDDPQVTVNQRFAVYFPEKRPFFLENASFFQTPIPLLFTRNVGDPRAGMRLTGKLGLYSVALLATDDRAPGELAQPSSDAAGKRASLQVVRVSRDVLRFSHVGMMATSYSFAGNTNRVAAVDGRFKLTDRWTAAAQVASSRTRSSNTDLSGFAANASLTRSGLGLTYSLEYTDRSPRFESRPGFIERVDLRQLDQVATYTFRPSGPRLLNWSTSVRTGYAEDHDGLRLDRTITPGVFFQFRRDTGVGLDWTHTRNLLRPSDFPALPQNRDYPRNDVLLTMLSNFSRRVSLTVLARRGDAINFAAPGGEAPFLGRGTSVDATFTLRPVASLQIDNTVLVTRLTTRAAEPVFTDSIVRTKWNFQMSRQTSLRLIVETSNLTANAMRTSLQPARRVNVDVLGAYLLHPGTALYLGYNSDRRNVDPFVLAQSGVVVPGRSLITTGRQVFMKVSYLFAL